MAMMVLPSPSLSGSIFSAQGIAFASAAAPSAAATGDAKRARLEALLSGDRKPSAASAAATHTPVLLQDSNNAAEVGPQEDPQQPGSAAKKAKVVAA